MYTKFLVLALAALSVAGPAHVARQNQPDASKDVSKDTSKDAPKQMFNKDSSCGKNSQVYCCNTQTTEKLTGKGTLPINADIADLKGLLGQCQELKIVNLVPVDVLKKTCSQETVCCGTTKQQGVANFGCTSVHT